MRRLVTSALVLLALLAMASCRFDPSYRDVVIARAPECVDGVVRCKASGAVGSILVGCDAGVETTIDDCGKKSQVCAPSVLACKNCIPGSTTCSGLDVVKCDPSGDRSTKSETCDASAGVACRRGMCVNLCDEAAQNQSNVGCDYFAVDLDNAVVPTGAAAAQQFAVVVSNTQPDLDAHVTVTEDRGKPGDPSNVRVLATATILPRNLEVFRLGPNEVDGSPDGEFDTGTGTALTRHAYRVKSDVPIVAYQFNPLENANVFSNDASQLLPVTALGTAGDSSYVIAAWPQTIARSEDPQTNFGADLRAFLAIVGTAPDTKVTVHTTARVIPGGPLPDGAAKGSDFSVTLQPYEVLNLETGEFNADFTGSRVFANKPVAVFPGSEASDAPFFSTLAARQCCADHLEEQAIPTRAVGKSYVLGHVPNRSRAVIKAGARIGPYDEPEYYRVVAVSSGVTTLTTTLDAPFKTIPLGDIGQSITLVSYGHFTLTADQPVIVADVQASQEAAGIPRGLPGGDPSLTYVPPVEQWRNDYVLLTPDKYSFDFLVLMTPKTAKVYLDGQLLSDKDCEILPASPKNDKYAVYTCQLSFPIIDPDKTAPNNLTPGRQNDGVHRVQADLPIGVLVYGFDSFVSYAYAGGTELRDLSLR